MTTHRALLTVFVLTGLVSSTWAARLPGTQDRLQLSPGRIGLVILCIEGGAMLGLPLGAVLTRRLGSRWAIWLGLAGYAPLLALLGFVPSPLWLGVSAAVYAAANSVVDVAMNTAGTELEAARDRSMLSGLHAGHSVGRLLGGGVAVLAAGIGLGVGAHFAVIAAVSTLAGFVAARQLAPGRTPAGKPRTRRLVLPGRHLVLLGAVAFCGFLVEEGGSNWSAIHLRTEHGVAPAIAAAGYTGFVVALAGMRAVGDQLVTRVGRLHVVRTGALVAVTGTLLLVVAPGPYLAVAGWIVVGLGIALIPPTVLGAAPGPTAIATVSTLGYLGSFTGPAVMATTIEYGGFSLALGSLGIAATLILLLAPRALRR